MKLHALIRLFLVLIGIGITGFALLAAHGIVERARPDLLLPAGTLALVTVLIGVWFGSMFVASGIHGRP